MAEDSHACSATERGLCDGLSSSMEEGLELLQVKGRMVTKSAGADADDFGKDTSGIEQFETVGIGCCGGARNEANGKLWAGITDDLDSCKAKCLDFDDCGTVEYGWTEGRTHWCFIWSKMQSCLSLEEGPGKCGPGGSMGVKAYRFMAGSYLQEVVHTEEGEEEVTPEYMGQEDIELEKKILEDSDFQKVSFRAKHSDWLDIIQLYNDGFFERYHSSDAGVWAVENNQLVLKWLRWDAEALSSTDGGETFATGNRSFTLKSYVRPVWWTNRFKNIALSDFSEEISKSDEADNAHDADGAYDTDSVNFTDSVNVSAIVAAHRNAWNSDLDEKGYQAIATLKDNAQMEAFIRRVVDFLGLKIKDEGGLQGMVPFYSGETSVQSFEKLVVELEYIAHAGGFRWVDATDAETSADSGTETDAEAKEVKRVDSDQAASVDPEAETSTEK